MVYCHRCGKKNEEDAKHCINCGAPIYSMKRRMKREDSCFGQPEKRVEEECFGIPYGGAIAGIIFGVFIILIGLSIALGLHIGRWIVAFIVFVIGLLIIVAVIFGRYRR